MNTNLTTSKILIVEDDVHICNLVSRFLKKHDYQVKFAHDGQNGLNIFQEFLPDLVILDINLPDILGYNLCEQMQKINNVYVIMLTGRADVEDKKKGFAKGADDYLTKPFDVEELLFRIQAILKRNRGVTSSQQELINIFDLTISVNEREAKINGILLHLTAIEFDLLYFLVSNPNQIWSRNELMENVWGEKMFGDNRVVDVHIGQIRRKLEKHSNKLSFIKTVRGIGYKANI